MLSEDDNVAVLFFTDCIKVNAYLAIKKPP